MAKDFDVRVDGLKEFRRDLKRTDKEATKGLQKELKEAVNTVAVGSRETAPRGPGSPKHKSGTLARSYKPFTRGNIAGVYSSVPYAGVQEFGGRISPKGTPITIRPHETVTRQVERHREQILDDVGDAIEAAARRTGWR